MNDKIIHHDFSNPADGPSKKPKRQRPANKIGRISKATSRVFTLRISLCDIEPEIFRIVEVEDITLAKLHRILQYSMGWRDCHLHQWETELGPFSDPQFGLNEDQGWGEQPFVGDSRRVRLSDLLRQVGDAVGYEYDFGDCWQHRIVAEAIADGPAEGVRYPRCVYGERACPPEDVGGVGGYEHFLAVIADPNDEDHEHFKQWSRHPRRGDFDPEFWDQELANSLMRI